MSTPDRPALPEIEITPEMIEAGDAILRAYDNRYDESKDVVSELIKTVLKKSTLGQFYRKCFFRLIKRIRQ